MSSTFYVSPCISVAASVNISRQILPVVLVSLVQVLPNIVILCSSLPSLFLPVVYLLHHLASFLFHHTTIPKRFSLPVYSSAVVILLLGLIFLAGQCSIFPHHKLLLILYLSSWLFIFHFVHIFWLIMGIFWVKLFNLALCTLFLSLVLVWGELIGIYISVRLLTDGTD